MAWERMQGKMLISTERKLMKNLKMPFPLPASVANFKVYVTELQEVCGFEYASREPAKNSG